MHRLAAILIALTVFLPTTPPCAAQDYRPFVVSWNQACARLKAPQKFRLGGERAISARTVIEALSQWCAIFVRQGANDCADDLSALADEMTKSSFLAYADFRAAHWRKGRLNLSPEMDAQELAQALNAYLGVVANGRHPDYVSRETVETVLYMNSFCAFFEGRLAKLHRRGIDLGINSCGMLSTNGKYPCLDSWLR